MAGTKLFINSTGKNLQVTLYIRLRENPANNAGNQTFQLAPSQQSWVTYGDAANVYLNGVSLVSIHDGQIQGSQDFVITRGSALDNELNTHNRVEFRYSGGAFEVAASNT